MRPKLDYYSYYCYVIVGLPSPPQKNKIMRVVENLYYHGLKY